MILEQLYQKNKEGQYMVGMCYVARIAYFLKREY
jgi:hypothetical protein